MIDPASQHGAATMAATSTISRPPIEPPRDGLGAYRVYECLGTGGFASVYRARRIDVPDACDLALKRLHPHLMSDDGAIRAFAREARLAYVLDHPAIRRVYSLVREPGELFMTMEYIDGVSVFDVLRRASAARRHLPLSGVLALLHRLCSALHYAHELVNELGVPAGLTHLDVSPSNLMIESGGRFKLIDMGVTGTRIDERASGSTLAKVQGKYGYMAPEVLVRGPFDRRADVFSVGVVAWELLTLCRLYPVSKPPVDIELVRSRPLEVPSAINPSSPAELDLIVARALAHDPRARWPSCAAMADALCALALRLRETISDAAIADLVDLVEDPATRPRLARGTSPPSPVVEAVPAPERPFAAVTAPPRRRRHVLAVGGLSVSLATLVVAGFAHGRFDLPAAVEPHADAPPSPSAPLAPVAAVAPVIPVTPVAPVTPIVPRPAARIVTVPAAREAASAPARLDGAEPRSWTAAYPYRARLCIDVEGKVASVEILDGPARLKARIVRALRRWRYSPVESPTCFVVSANIEKVPGR